MTLRRIGNILTAAGLLVTAGAVGWWYAFYSIILGELARAPNAPAGGNSVFDVRQPAQQPAFDDVRFIKRDIDRRLRPPFDQLTLQFPLRRREIPVARLPADLTLLPEAGSLTLRSPGETEAGSAGTQLAKG